MRVRLVIIVLIVAAVALGALWATQTVLRLQQELSSQKHYAKSLVAVENALWRAISDVRESRDALATQIQDATNAVVRLQETYHAEKEANDPLRAQLVQTVQEGLRKDHALQQMTERANGLQASLKTSTDALQAAEAERGGLRDQVARAKADAEQKAADIARLNVQAQEHNNTIAALRKAVADAAAEGETRKQENAKLTQELQAARAEQDRLARELADAQKKLGVEPPKPAPAEPK